MDIYLNRDASATVTEVWTVNDASGDEYCHTIYGKGNYYTEFISVSDDRGVNYSNRPWDVNDNFAGKANSFGTYRDNYFYNLCWGVSKTGKSVYTIKYKINNLVLYTRDKYQILAWDFIPQNMTNGINKVSINISSFKSFDYNLGYWTYGNKGAKKNVVNGNIFYTSNGGFNSDDFVFFLIKFDDSPFVCNYYTDETFSEIQTRIEKIEGERIENEIIESNNTETNYNGSSYDYSSFFIFLLVFTLLFITVFSSLNNKKHYKYDSFGTVLLEDAPIFRDLPFGDDWVMAYYFVRSYNLNNDRSDLLGAVILKLIRDGCLEFKNGEEGLEDVLFLIKDPVDHFERYFYHLLKRIAKKGELTSSQLIRFCSVDNSLFSKWEQKVYSEARNRLLADKLLMFDEGNSGLFNYKIILSTEKANEYARQMAGLKKFLNSFSTLSEKDPIEVKQWNNYLIYAMLLGVANEVERQFDNLYPDRIDGSGFNAEYYMFYFMDVYFK